MCVPHCKNKLEKGQDYLQHVRRMPPPQKRRDDACFWRWCSVELVMVIHTCALGVVHSSFSSLWGEVFLPTTNNNRSTQLSGRRRLCGMSHDECKVMLVLCAAQKPRDALRRRCRCRVDAPLSTGANNLPLSEMLSNLRKWNRDRKAAVSKHKYKKVQHPRKISTLSVYFRENRA